MDFKIVQVKRGSNAIKPLWHFLNNIENIKFTIMGGYVRYMCSPRKNPIKAKDVDIYCDDQHSFDRIDEALRKELNIQHENSMAVSYSVPGKDDKEKSKHKFYYCPPIQLIKPMTKGRIVSEGNLEKILMNFDFTVIRIGLTSLSEALADLDFEKHETSTKLVIKNVHCPISSTLRCCKYTRKGYFLGPLQAMELFLDWENRTLEYKSELVTKLKELNNGKEMTQKEIDEFEALMRID